MSVTDLTARRWHKDTDPNHYDPADALRMALKAIEAGDIKPEHIIVVHGEINDQGRSHVGYFQAGKYTELGQVGLMSRAHALISAFED